MDKRLAIALVVIVLMVDSAFAQAVVVQPNTTTTVKTTIDYGQAFGFLQPYVIAFVSTLLTAAGAWITYLVHKYTGIRIDESLSKGYILNAQNQASGLIAKGFVKIKENGKVEIDSPALAAAVNDLLNAVPQAAARFELKPSEVANKIVAMVPQVPVAPMVNDVPINGTFTKPK